MKALKIKVVEVQLGIGLNMFFPDFRKLVFVDGGYEDNKVLPVDASFADPYKSVAKSTKNKKAKL